MRPTRRLRLATALAIPLLPAAARAELKAPELTAPMSSWSPAQQAVVMEKRTNYGYGPFSAGVLDGIHVGDDILISAHFPMRQ